MKIYIGNREADIELFNREENQVRLYIDGKNYEIDITMLQDGLYSILENGKSYNAEFSYSEDRKNYKVNVAFSSHNIQIPDKKRNRFLSKLSMDEQQDDKIISPMPGKVVRIPVQVGDQLQAGETVIIIETMKMQNNYKVASDCIIKEIVVAEDEIINSSQLLIRLDLINVEK